MATTAAHSSSSSSDESTNPKFIQSSEEEEEEIEIPKRTDVYEEEEEEEDDDEDSSDEESENPKVVPESEEDEGDNFSPDDEEKEKETPPTAVSQNNEDIDNSSSNSEEERETPPAKALDVDEMAGIVSGSPEKLSSQNDPNSSSPLALKASNSEQKKKKTIWTEANEVALIEGMIAFRDKNGFDPTSNWDASYAFVKKFLSFDTIRKKQVRDKFWKLNKKYNENALKDGKLLQLSILMWGEDETGAKTGKRKLRSNGVGDLVEREESKGERISKKAKKEKPLNIGEEKVALCDKVVDFGDKYPRLKEALEKENADWFLKEGKRANEIFLSKISDEKAKALEEKWKRFHVMEAELKLMRLDFVREQTMMLVDLLKPN